LARLLRRHGLTSGWKIGLARQCFPVHYVLFDLLYYRDRCPLKEPLAGRRELLAEACRRLDVAEVHFSEAVVGHARALYAAALTQGHEGIVAKHRATPYRPGRRSVAWRKIKPRPQRNTLAARRCRDLFPFANADRGSEGQLMYLRYTRIL